MTEIDEPNDNSDSTVAKLPLAATLVALVGLADSVYLTIQHFTTTPVPCSILEGCETVLTSPYAEFAGVPIAAFGAIAYFTAFSMALLAAFGNRLTWKLFGLQVVLMAAFTAWLLYLQGFVIGAFCQFCLISAVTTFILLILFGISYCAHRN
ncbi:MAG: vitamin K epoxide reductase family protein [Blastocatellia bacterium]